MTDPTFVICKGFSVWNSLKFCSVVRKWENPPRVRCVFEVGINRVMVFELLLELSLNGLSREGFDLVHC